MKQRTMMALAAAIFIASWAHAAPRPEDAEAPRAERLPVKPGGPIAVEYRLGTTPVVGAPLEIAITAQVDEGVENISIETNASSPQAVLLTQPEVVAKAADGVYSWNITVVPLTLEAGYLTVVISGEVDGLNQGRSVTVPLSSATRANAEHGSSRAAGDELIALPVQESP